MEENFIYGQSGKGKSRLADSVKIAQIEKLKSNLDKQFHNLSFQIDFINNQITTNESNLVDFLNSKSMRLEHLLDEEPKLIRWWFDSLESALNAMTKISNELNHRLICIEKNALFIQVGEFKLKSE